MKKFAISFFAIFWVISIYAQTWRAQECLACGQGILLLKKQALWLTLPQRKTSFNYNDLLISTVRDIYSNSCLTNVVLTAQKILILDNKLALIKSQNIRQLNITKPTQLALENMHSVWVYDSYENSLKKVDLRLGVVSQSINLHCLCDSVREMIYTGNKLFFSCTKGIYSLDNMLNIKLEYKGETDDFDFLGRRLIILHAGVIFSGDDTLQIDKNIRQLCGQLNDKEIVGLRKNKYSAVDLKIR